MRPQLAAQEAKSGRKGKNLQEKFYRAGASLLINQRHDTDLRGIPLSILGIDFPSSSGSLQQLSAATDSTRVKIALSHQRVLGTIFGYPQGGYKK